MRHVNLLQEAVVSFQAEIWIEWQNFFFSALLPQHTLLNQRFSQVSCYQGTICHLTQITPQTAPGKQLKGFFTSWGNIISPN